MNITQAISKDFFSPAPVFPGPSEPLIQTLEDIKKELVSPPPIPERIPKANIQILPEAISRVHETAIAGLHRTSKLSVLLSPITKPIEALIHRILSVWKRIFEKQLPPLTIESILDQLKRCRALSFSQHDEILHLSQGVDKKSALILLANHLGFSTAEISPLLVNALQKNPQHAFLLLFGCFFIKRLSEAPNIQYLMNQEDRKVLSELTPENLYSTEHIDRQIRTLQSLSDRYTVRTWLSNLSDLLIPVFNDAQEKAIVSSMFGGDRGAFQKRLKALRLTSTELWTCNKFLKNNDIRGFSHSIQPFMKRIAEARICSHDVTNESLYAKELLDSIDGSFSFASLASEVRGQRMLSDYACQFRNLKKISKKACDSGMVSASLARALKESQELLNPAWISELTRFLKNPICPTFQATQLGVMNRSVRRIKDLSDRVGKEKQRPLSSVPTKHISYLSCSCGGGHNAMVRGLQGSLQKTEERADLRFSTEVIDVPREVTRSLDPFLGLFKKIGINFDAQDLYNWFLRNDLVSWIHLLRTVFSRAPDPVKDEKTTSLIRRKILATKPDVMNSVYSFDIHNIDTVAKEIGIPHTYVATDLDLDEWGANRPTSPFFKEAVPSLSNNTIRSSLRIPENKAEEIGLCVGPEFEHRLSEQELAAVKAKYHIAPNEKVVMFSSGGAAVTSTIPEDIVEKYRDSKTPIRLFVVCGKNVEFKSYLETTIAPLISNNSPVRMEVLGFQSRASMAELTQIADVVIGKPGGLSTMEFIKTGTRVIFDETGFRMSWEHFNARVVTNTGQGVVMTDQDTLIDLLSDSLRKPRFKITKMATITASERYRDLITKLIYDARSNEKKHMGQEKCRSWYDLSRRMNQAEIRL